MNKTRKKKLTVSAILIDRNIENYIETTRQLSARLNEPLLFWRVTKNQLPPEVILKECSLTIIDDIYDTHHKLRLQEASIHPLRQLKLKQSSPPVVPIQVPGVTMALGGESVVVKKEPSAPKIANSDVAASLRMSSILKKVGDEKLFYFVINQHGRYQRDLHSKLIAGSLITEFYKIRYPTAEDIAFVAKQIDQWARGHKLIRYNPTRKKFVPILTTYTPNN